MRWLCDAGFHPRDGGGVGDIQLVGVEKVFLPIHLFRVVSPVDDLATLIRQTVEAAEKALG